MRKLDSILYESTFKKLENGLSVKVSLSGMAKADEVIPDCWLTRLPTALLFVF